ncbi:MAG: class I SAM-dependent RNA methyltransferase [Saprospiraceae bacterium]|jgi:putative N6-adenine-specific DNA methylase|nr:class I SAM-dependent RNA methyltransferase [Saprospiraceae bacterium]
MTRTIVIKTLQGLEQVLATELAALGATDIAPLKRAVSCTGDQRLLYRANYELRTAMRVLVPIRTFRATNEKAYYQAVRETDWSKYLDVSDTLAVEAMVAGDYFKHSQYAALLTKDAIVDQFRDKFDRRPSVNLDAPTLRIHTRINGSECTLLLDSSGDSLHKRGYRRDIAEAPLSEVLAAGMILLTGWAGDSPFVDPMCGSGTLPIEAAMIAMNMPPQHKRESFGFFKWKGFNRKLWEEVKSEADARIRQPAFPIFASDKEVRARNSTAINLLSAGLENVVQVEKIPFEKLVPPETPGILVTNPPYDERIKVEEIEAFYKSIGDRLKQQWTGWTAWLISSNMDAWKTFGLRPSRKITLYNGPLECYFQKFELYEGKKGAKSIDASGVGEFED